ncbi:hypothetical protein D3C80_1786350 [compost metagenome]
MKNEDEKLHGHVGHGRIGLELNGMPKLFCHLAHASKNSYQNDVASSDTYFWEIFLAYMYLPSF